jgi:hypothetical protein
MRGMPGLKAMKRGVIINFRQFKLKMNFQQQMLVVKRGFSIVGGPAQVESDNTVSKET